MDIAETLPDLSPAIARHTLESVCAALPTPVPDTPERRATRDERAFTALAALRPADPVEAMLASQIVLLSAHGADCVRLSVQPGLDPETVRRLRSQAGTMARRERAALRLLQNRQRARGAAPGKWPSAPPVPNQAARRAAEAEQQRAARIRALDLRLIDPPPSIH